MIEEFCALFRGWKRTGVVLPEDAIAVAGDAIVDKVSEESRKDTSDFTNYPPDSAQPLGHGQSRIGTGKYLFVRFAGLKDDVHRIQAVRG